MNEEENVGSSGSSVSSYDLLDSPPSEPFTDVERVSEDEHADQYIDKEEAAKLLHNYVLESLKYDKENPSFFSPQFSPYYSEGEDDDEEEQQQQEEKNQYHKELERKTEEVNKVNSSVNLTSVHLTKVNENINVKVNVNDINEGETLFDDPVVPSNPSIYSEKSSLESNSSTSSLRVDASESVQSLSIDPKQEVLLTQTHPISITSEEVNPQTSIAYVQRYDRTVFWIVKKRENENEDENEETGLTENLTAPVEQSTENRLVQRQPQPQDFFELRLNKKQLSSSLFLSFMLFTHVVAFGAGLLLGKSNRIMSRMSTATSRSE